MGKHLECWLAEVEESYKTMCLEARLVSPIVALGSAWSGAAVSMKGLRVYVVSEDAEPRAYQYGWDLILPISRCFPLSRLDHILLPLRWPPRSRYLSRWVSPFPFLDALLLPYPSVAYQGPVVRLDRSSLSPSNLPLSLLPLRREPESCHPPRSVVSFPLLDSLIPSTRWACYRFLRWVVPTTGLVASAVLLSAQRKGGREPTASKARLRVGSMVWSRY